MNNYMKNIYKLRICRCILFTTFISTQIIKSTPPSPPENYGEIKGEILYAVWRDKYEVKEIRLYESESIKDEVIIALNSPKWYLVIKPQKNFKKNASDVIDFSTRLQPLCPRIPAKDVFPENSMLVALNGDKSLPISVGKTIILSNFKHQIQSDAEGISSVDKIVLK